MGPIQKAIDQVRYSIPADILNAVFKPRDQHWNRVVPLSADQMIRDIIIEGRVKQDCDVYGGQQLELPLYNLVPEVVDLYNLVFRIPKEMVQGRTITSVLSMMYGWPGSYASGSQAYNSSAVGFNGAYPGAANGYSPLLGEASEVLLAQQPIPVMSTARGQIIGENVICVSDTSPASNQLTMRVMVSNDPELTNIKPPSWIHFGNLVLLAVKSYIYNQMVIQLGQGQLQGGMELGVFGRIIESYADAETSYQEYLQTRWRKVAAYNDTLIKRRALNLASGRR